MTDIIKNSYIQSSSGDSKGLAKEQILAKKTENNLTEEPLKKADQQATDSLVDRMIDDQQDKVDPGVNVTKNGTLDLSEGQLS